MRSYQLADYVIFAAVFVGVILLAGCQTVQPQVITREHYIVATPDESLRHCTPRIGERPVLNDSADEAELIARLDNRGNDCSDKLSSVWDSIDAAVRRAQELNAREH